MRLNSCTWLTILVLGLFTIGPVVAPCSAAVSDSPAEKSAPIITNATLAGEETAPGKASFETSSLSLSLTADKPVYLTGEPINITVSTSTTNTHVRVQAQLPRGRQETLGDFTTNGTYAIS